MKDFLQGKPLGHPLHPFLVHFPIALFIFSFVLDLARLAWPAVSGLSQGAFCSMAAGLAMALVAAVPASWIIQTFGAIIRGGNLRPCTCS